MRHVVNKALTHAGNHKCGHAGQNLAGAGLQKQRMSRWVENQSGLGEVVSTPNESGALPGS